MSTINFVLGKRINMRNRKRLHNTTFSLISSNCNGALILHDLGVKFNSPFVDMWMKPKDYIKLLKNISNYLQMELQFDVEEKVDYAVGKLGDVKLYFQHFQSEEEAKRKWEERLKRINFDNIFILFSDRDGCTYDDLCDFDKLPFENKVVFTHIPYPKIKSACYIRGWEDCESVGMCSMFRHRFSGVKYYDDFDYVKWFNRE